MARRPPERDVLPVAQRLRIRYAKRGRLRFSSHRDFQRALERALRRAEVPIAFSAGFSPHPKISYANAAPTGAASEAEYLEIGVTAACDPDDLRARLDAALPDGLDIVDVVVARTPDLAARLEASAWQAVLPGGDVDSVRSSLAEFMGRDRVEVERLTKGGMRSIDARGPVLEARVDRHESGAPVIHMLIAHALPTARPDDVLSGIRSVRGLPEGVIITRLAQGPLVDGRIEDPLAADRA